MTSLTKNTNEMPHRITTILEFKMAVFTVLSTFATSEIILKIIVAIVAYTSARLFYYYFGNRIKETVSKIKKWKF